MLFGTRNFLLAVIAALLMDTIRVLSMPASARTAISKLRNDLTNVQNELLFMRYVLSSNVLPGDGTWQRPARSCKELMLSHPEKRDGLYYIDPNGIKGEDAFQVTCNMTLGGWTIINGGFAPKLKSRRQSRAATSQKKRRARKYSKSHVVSQGYRWSSELSNNGHEIAYEISDEQLKFLRAISNGVRQQVRFRCRHIAVWSKATRTQASTSQRRTTQFFSWANETFSIDDRRISIRSSRNMCKTSRAMGKTKLTMSAAGDAMDLFPVRDFALFNASVMEKRFAELESIKLIFL